MDEEIAIIDSNTRLEKLKNFFIKKKKFLTLFLSLAVFILITFFGYGEYKKKNKTEISDSYHKAIIEYSGQNKDKIVRDLISIINKKDPTYSPLSLYFIIDKNLISDKQVINDLFLTIINDTALEKEIKNLIIYKRALFFADHIEENALLEILNPLIKSESIWSAHALYLLGEYYYSKNEKQKSKEFFIKIQSLKNINQDIQKETQKRLNRDFSE